MLGEVRVGSSLFFASHVVVLGLLVYIKKLWAGVGHRHSSRNKGRSADILPSKKRCGGEDETILHSDVIIFLPDEEEGGDDNCLLQVGTVGWRRVLESAGILATGLLEQRERGSKGTALFQAEGRLVTKKGGFLNFYRLNLSSHRVFEGFSAS